MFKSELLNYQRVTRQKIRGFSRKNSSVLPIFLRKSDNISIFLDLKMRKLPYFQPYFPAILLDMEPLVNQTWLVSMLQWCFTDFFPLFFQCPVGNHVTVISQYILLESPQKKITIHNPVADTCETDSWVSHPCLLSERFKRKMSRKLPYFKRKSIRCLTCAAESVEFSAGFWRGREASL